MVLCSDPVDLKVRDIRTKTARREGHVKEIAESGIGSERRRGESCICRKAEKVSAAVAAARIQSPGWYVNPDGAVALEKFVGWVKAND